MVRALCDVGPQPQKHRKRPKLHVYHRFLLPGVRPTLRKTCIYLISFYIGQDYARVNAHNLTKVDINSRDLNLNDSAVDPAARAAGHRHGIDRLSLARRQRNVAGRRAPPDAPARRGAGLALFGKGARHLTAETLYEEATLAKVPVSSFVLTVYNTLNQLTDAGLLRQASSTAPRPTSTPTSPRIITIFENNHELVEHSRPASGAFEDARCAGGLRDGPRRGQRGAPAQEALILSRLVVVIPGHAKRELWCAIAHLKCRS